MEKQLFIESITSIEIGDRSNIPTVLHYGAGEILIGHDALERAQHASELNENFKIALGNLDPSGVHRRYFHTADGGLKSAHELTDTFVKGLLAKADPWLSARGLANADRILVAEPLIQDEVGVTRADWLANYRNHLKRILGGRFKEVDFLPEPFAVFQYYRYGLRHPLVAEQRKHVALVIDFGGGTFDISVIETAASGDISGSGRNSRPLAASSRPVGGYVVNKEIATRLLLQSLTDASKKSDVNEALRKFDQWKRDPSSKVSDLRADYQTFFRHFGQLLREIEAAKLSICNSITNWDLEDERVDGLAVTVRVPATPLKQDGGFRSVRLDPVVLREIFLSKLWKPLLRPAIDDALKRASVELQARPISLVLLSGGSANIRWLAKLIEKEKSSGWAAHIGQADLLEMQGSFQEIVAKGLAAECARRSQGQGSGDFRAVTYNRLCLTLNSDDRGNELVRFKPLAQELPQDLVESGVLLRASSVLSHFVEKPIQWKFRLSHPPRRHLDYYFLRSTLDPDETSSRHNMEESRLHSGKGNFDASLLVELTVSADGTATPKFVYRSAGHGVAEISKKGRPFYLDMTHGSEAVAGDAYIGLDFGSTNSALSFVSRTNVRAFEQRAKRNDWRTLLELVDTLPFPIACALGQYLAESDERRLPQMAGKALEAFLMLASYLAYSEHRAQLSGGNWKLFKSLGQRSAGPLWNLLKLSLERLGNKASFSAPFRRLLEWKEIDECVTAFGRMKHEKGGEVDWNSVLERLANVTAEAFSPLKFGHFENVQRKRFGAGFTGQFRSAVGRTASFVEVRKYEGNHSFADSDAVVYRAADQTALSLSPLLFWIHDAAGLGPVESRLFTFDRPRQDEAFEYKIVGRSEMLTVDGEGEFGELFSAVKALREKDEPLEPYDRVLVHEMR